MGINDTNFKMGMIGAIIGILLAIGALSAIFIGYTIWFDVDDPNLEDNPEGNEPPDNTTIIPDDTENGTTLLEDSLWIDHCNDLSNWTSLQGTDFEKYWLAIYGGGYLTDDFIASDGVLKPEQEWWTPSSYDYLHRRAAVYYELPTNWSELSIDMRVNFNPASISNPYSFQGDLQFILAGPNLEPLFQMEIVDGAASGGIHTATHRAWYFAKGGDQLLVLPFQTISNPVLINESFEIDITPTNVSIKSPVMNSHTLLDQNTSEIFQRGSPRYVIVFAYRKLCATRPPPEIFEIESLTVQSKAGELDFNTSSFSDPHSRSAISRELPQNWTELLIETIINLNVTSIENPSSFEGNLEFLITGPENEPLFEIELHDGALWDGGTQANPHSLFYRIWYFSPSGDDIRIGIEHYINPVILSGNFSIHITSSTVKLLIPGVSGWIDLGLSPSVIFQRAVPHHFVIFAYRKNVQTYPPPTTLSIEHVSVTSTPSSTEDWVDDCSSLSTWVDLRNTNFDSLWLAEIQAGPITIGFTSTNGSFTPSSTWWYENIEAIETIQASITLKPKLILYEPLILPLLGFSLMKLPYKLNFLTTHPYKVSEGPCVLNVLNKGE
jgi:hypothetical protein